MQIICLLGLGEIHLIRTVGGGVFGVHDQFRQQAEELTRSIMKYA